MTRPGNNGRHIKPETICIGDTIRVTWKHKDVTKSNVGVVAKREVWTHSTTYLTAEGAELLTHFRYTPNNETITLLNRPSEQTPQLEGMELPNG